MPGADDPATPTRILLIEDSNTNALLIQSGFRKADPTFQVHARIASRPDSASSIEVTWMSCCST